MNELEMNLKLVKDVIEGKTYVRFIYIYPFTTENIKGYMSNLDLKDKSIITVGSSADQVINSFLYGSKDITLFDINPFTKYYFELKKAGILLLEFNSFYEFFSNNINSFNIKTYSLLRNNLSKETKLFWDSLFNSYDSYFFRDKLFSKDERALKTLVKYNPYMDEINYNILKTTIDSLNPIFINSSLNEIKSKVVRKYDYVFLSNISSYLRLYTKENISKFINTIKDLTNILNKSGSIYLAYIYDRIKNKIDDDILTDISFMNYIFDNKITEHTFESISYKNGKDAVLIYKR